MIVLSSLLLATQFLATAPSLPVRDRCDLTLRIAERLSGASSGAGTVPILPLHWSGREFEPWLGAEPQCGEGKLAVARPDVATRAPLLVLIELDEAAHHFLATFIHRVDGGDSRERIKGRIEVVDGMPRVEFDATMESGTRRWTSVLDGGFPGDGEPHGARVADKIVVIDGGSCQGGVAMFWSEPRSCWASEVAPDRSTASSTPFPGIFEGNVRCDDSATVCGESVVCECGRGAAPCANQHVTTYQQAVRFDGGGGCFIEVSPPRAGECTVKGATRHPEGGVADWRAYVRFGETRIVGGCARVTCSCDQFEPEDGGTQCSYRLVSRDNDGCTLAVTACGKHGCLEHSVPMLRTETRDVCHDRYTCK